MSDKIISLCYVNSRRERSVELCRIADYVDGKFMPYEQDRFTNFNETDRDLIYASATEIKDEVGTIGCFEWSAYMIDYQDNWRTETHAYNMSWTEVVQMSCITPGALQERLQHGWKPKNGFDGGHDVLFCLNQSRIDRRYGAMYVPSYAFVYRDEKWFINDKITALEYGTIDFHDTYPCSCRYARSDTRRYLSSIDRFKVKSKLLLKNVDEIISEIIRSTVSSMSFSRKERQLARNALEMIDHAYVQEKIVDKLDCSEEEAKQYLHEFLATRKYRLENDEAVGIMEKLIAIDSNYVASLREKIQAQWEQEQADRLRAAQQEVDDKKNELQEIQSRVNEEARKIEDIARRQQEAEQAVQAAIHFREDVEKQIEDRLQKIRDNQPSVLVDTAFLRSIVQPEKRSGPVSDAHELVMPLGEAPGEAVIKDALTPILDACADLCGDHQECYEALAVFLLSAYIRSQPLLMIGEAAVEAAELYARAATGRGCIRLFPSEAMDVDAIAGQLYHDACVCVVDGLERGYARTRELMRRMPDVRFVLTANHLEALYMEPESLYTSFVPVVTDLFFEGDRVIVWPEESCAKALNAMGAKLEKLPPSKALRTAQRSYFKDGFVSPMLKRRCLELQSCMTALSKEIGLSAPGVEDYSRLYLFAGMLKLLHRREAFKRLIDDCKTLDEDTRATLCAFGGIEDE